MDRRSFLRGLGMVVAGVAIDQAIPLGRVWSFPSKIVLASSADCIALQLEKVSVDLPLPCHLQEAKRRMIEGIRNSSLDIDHVWVHPEQYKAYIELAELDDAGFRITGITVPQND